MKIIVLRLFIFTWPPSKNMVSNYCGLHLIRIIFYMFSSWLWVGDFLSSNINQGIDNRTSWVVVNPLCKYCLMNPRTPTPPPNPTPIPSNPLHQPTMYPPCPRNEHQRNFSQSKPKRFVQKLFANMSFVKCWSCRWDLSEINDSYHMVHLAILYLHYQVRILSH